MIHCRSNYFPVVVWAFILLCIYSFSSCSSPVKKDVSKQEDTVTIEEQRFISRTVNVQTEEVQLYWKNDAGELLKNLSNLKSYVESKQKKLVFAMNAGMFKKDFSPQGLFIRQQQLISPLDTSSGEGNFYLKPNGVFYITSDKKAHVCQTNEYANPANVTYATQSGPMLVINGSLHPGFKQGSTYLHIRNGVGVLPDGNLLFAMSKDKINLYDFATYFRQKGCMNALYLDGFVSRTYYPAKNWEQTEGDLGVMIGVTK